MSTRKFESIKIDKKNDLERVLFEWTR